jgi:hypothetical protein
MTEKKEEERVYFLIDWYLVSINILNYLIFIWFSIKIYLNFKKNILFEKNQRLKEKIETILSVYFFVTTFRLFTIIKIKFIKNFKMS